MQKKYTFFSEDVGACNEMEAWWGMINSIVNFLSASATLATSLDNHMITDIGEAYLHKFRPLLTEAPLEPPEDIYLADFPWFVELLLNLTGNIYEKPTELAENVVILTPEHIGAVLSYAQEEVHSEPSYLPQSVGYMSTQNMGDCYNLEAARDQIEYNPCAAQNQNVCKRLPLPYDSGTFTHEDQPKLRKSSESDHSCFFHDYTDSDQTINSLNLQSSYEYSNDTENSAFKFGKISDEKLSKSNQNESERATNEEEIYVGNLPPMIIHGQSIQGKREEGKSLEEIIENLRIIRNDEAQSGSTSKFKDSVKTLITKSAELQRPLIENLRIITNDETQSGATSKFKDSVKTLITKSAELQRPIINEEVKAKISSFSTKDKRPSKASPNAAKALSEPSQILNQEQTKYQEKNVLKKKSVPKNISELKEQLDLIKQGSKYSTADKKLLSHEQQSSDSKKQSKVPLRMSNKDNKTEKSQSQIAQCIKPDGKLILTKESSMDNKNVKLSKRYTNVESMVKKLIKGVPKLMEQNENNLETPKKPSNRIMLKSNYAQKPSERKRPSENQLRAEGKLPIAHQGIRSSSGRRQPTVQKSEESKVTEKQPKIAKKTENPKIVRLQSALETKKKIKTSPTPPPSRMQQREKIVSAPDSENRTISNNRSQRTVTNLKYAKACVEESRKKDKDIKKTEKPTEDSRGQAQEHAS